MKKLLTVIGVSLLVGCSGGPIQHNSQGSVKDKLCAPHLPTTGCTWIVGSDVNAGVYQQTHPACRGYLQWANGTRRTFYGILRLQLVGVQQVHVGPHCHFIYKGK